jgi:hypothetical protein
MHRLSSFEESRLGGFPDNDDRVEKHREMSCDDRNGTTDAIDRGVRSASAIPLDRLRFKALDRPRPLGPPSLDLLELIRGRVQVDETIDRLGQAPPADRRDRLLAGPHPLVAPAEHRPGLGVRPDG